MEGRTTRKPYWSKKELQRYHINHPIIKAFLHPLLNKTSHFSLPQEYNQYLKIGQIEKELSDAFKKEQFTLSKNAHILQTEEKEWEIIDDMKIYEFKEIFPPAGSQSQMRIICHPFDFRRRLTRPDLIYLLVRSNISNPPSNSILTNYSKEDLTAITKDLRVYNHIENLDKALWSLTKKEFLFNLGRGNYEYAETWIELSKDPPTNADCINCQENLISAFTEIILDDKKVRQFRRSYSMDPHNIFVIGLKTMFQELPSPPDNEPWDFQILKKKKSKRIKHTKR